MSETTYRVQSYVRFTASEFIALILTALFAALALSIRDLFFERFGESVSIMAFLLLFIFSLFILLVTVWLCKIAAVRIGHVIRYRAHIGGLIVGVAITMMTAGYLPLFIPGGFVFEQPDRLRVGKFFFLHKGWEVGLVSGTFPLIMLLWITLLSPLYLLSHADLYLMLIGLCALTAVYALIPLPFFTTDARGRRLEWYRYFRGSTFGLDLIYASLPWYYILVSTTITYGVLAYILTKIEVQSGIFIYLFLLFVSVVGFYIYPKFFQGTK